VPRWVDGLILVIVVGVSVAALGYDVQVGIFGFSLLSDQGLSWHLVRSAGLAAYVLLGASTLWGTFLSTRAIKDWSPGPVSLLLHATTSWLAVILGFSHAGLLLFDKYYHYTPVDLLVPFVGPYRPLAVGLGTSGAWLALAITLSFSLRKLIGQRNWRLLHYTSYVTFALVTIHALLAGTDANKPGMLVTISLFVILIAAMLAFRIGRSVLHPKPAHAHPIARAQRQRQLPGGEPASN
jgi:predicted ferric reductase